MIDEIPGPDIFEPMCIGRYQMDMPKGTIVSDLVFRSFDLKGKFTQNSSEDGEYGGLFSGNSRHQKWTDWVSKNSKENHGNNFNYIIDKNGNDYRILSTHVVFRPETKPSDMIETYIKKDFPSLKLSVGLKADPTKTIYFHSKYKDYKPYYQRFLKPIPEVTSLYKHQPWPHNQLGVCLDKNITFNTVKAADDEYLRVIYRYGQKTFFQFYFDAYPAGSYSELQEYISQKLGLLSMFASDYFTFGGHTGKLFLSGDRYNPEATRFRWYATDAKAGSTRNPYISIEGRVDINDFPEYRNMNNIDSDAIALAILSSLRPRENGLVGTK
ncbi:hypothetical protein [Pelagibaculum spongiae]|nr:hypothetical protein [Pelagibaculum spongiae]